MAVSAVNTASAVNVNSSVNSLVIPFASTGATQGIVVHVGIHSKMVTVASVTDSVGNVYTKQQSNYTKFEEDYVVDEYAIPPAGAITHHGIEAECWTTRATTGTVANVTVTLTSGARFGVVVQGYSGVSAIGASANVGFVSTSTPSISVTTTAANSWVSAGFASNSGLNWAASTGTLRGQIQGGTVTADAIVGVAVADNTIAGTAACTVAVQPTNTETISGDNLVNSNINAIQITIPVPMTYAVCAVELKA